MKGTIKIEYKLNLFEIVTIRGDIGDKSARIPSGDGLDLPIVSLDLSPCKRSHELRQSPKLQIIH